MDIKVAKKEMKMKYEELYKRERWYKADEAKLEEKMNELRKEKEELEIYRNDLYNRYFKINRGDDFIFLDDIPSFDLICGKKCVISDYSNIDLLNLCKCLEAIYKRYNIEFKFNVIEKSISYKEYDRECEWLEYNNHPCMDITINGNYNFYIPYESAFTEHSSNIKLVQREIKNGYDISYVENYYKELPFEYKRFITIRDLIYSIAYFKYQNKINNISNYDFDAFIYKPLVKKLNSK